MAKKNQAMSNAKLYIIIIFLQTINVVNGYY